MCGRFTLASDAETLQQTFFDFEVPTNLSPRYNISPTQDVAGVSNTPEKQVEFFHWGLIPSWAKDPKIGNRMINARSETLAEKPSFRNAYKRRRCLVLADGYYEWQKIPGDRVKQPVYIRLKSQKPFAVAGLWEVWQTRDMDEPLKSCTIITCPPNAMLADIHHRMPVILPQDAYAQWLSPDEQPADALQSLLIPYPGEEMEAYPVSRFVNRPTNDSPECIAPLETNDLRLF
ncbi:SOS response-associated peptidase [Candidatus Poribacteria bacterium]|nr:SOS response-associated peptidase [Candidatus Poribacteria bacterium]MXY27856.1 SOS response-associated peptidase [Candidatus Poribacteria bacterium]MYK20010.1 SOS response-associated peptidase [Candidatus Poribacteria bacterium]